MPEIPASLAEFATRELRGARDGDPHGHDARLRRREARPRSPPASASRPALLCWTAGRHARAGGARAGPAARPGRPHRGRRDHAGGGHATNVWAIGDAAAVPDPAKRRRAPSPPTGQHAIRQGRRVAENVAATLAGEPPQPFRYRTLGVFVDMGQHKAVATMLGVRAARLPGLVRGAHLPPGDDARARRGRLRLVADWTVGLFFGRASAELGQLGHPPALSDAREERGRPVSVLSFREGRASDLRATFELRRGRARRVAQGARAAARRARARRAEDLDAQLGARARPARVHRRRSPTALRDLRGRTTRWWATRAIARFGAMDELTELWVAPSHPGRGVGRALLERCWPEPPTPELGPRGARHRHARRPHALHASSA